MNWRRIARLLLAALVLTIVATGCERQDQGGTGTAGGDAATVTVRSSSSDVYGVGVHCYGKYRWFDWPLSQEAVDWINTCDADAHTGGSGGMLGVSP